MKYFLIIIFSFALLSCSNKSENNKNSDKTEFEMYNMSEMAALMEQMYIDNERLKQKIINADSLGSFPEHFLKIHNAVMTDAEDNDAFFKEQAQLFLDAQHKIYENKKNTTENYNKAIDACINCHRVKCTGPIPKIKKLYIK